MKKQSYIDLKFTGIKSFLDALREKAIEFKIFNDDLTDLFDGDLLKREDHISNGIILQDEQRAYFSEIAVKITKNYFAHTVFIFDHHPTIVELKIVVQNLEEIISEELNNLDLEKLTEIAQQKNSQQ